MSTTTVSVVIPSAGYAESLRLCLESLRIQAIEGGLEVLVVLDGGSAARADGIRQLRRQTEWLWPLRWIETDGPRGPAAARNRGMAEAGGRYLIFIDDDMVVTPDFVAEHLKMLAENPGTAIIGAIKTRLIGYGGAYRGWVEGFWAERHQRLTDNPITNFYECYSGNLALAAADARRVGGFDESIATCEDVDFGLRLARAGVRLQYGSRAIAVQLFRKSPSQYMRDGALRGATTATLWRRYPESRRALSYAVPKQGALGTRWLRRRALASRWRWESIGGLLPHLPDLELTRLLGGFLYNVAAARGARGDFPEDQWIGLSEGTLMLCYRGFQAPGEKPSKVSIAKERFARQLRVLMTAGYRFLTLRELIEAHDHDGVPRGLTAIIVFDDANADVLASAAPLLQAIQVPAVVSLSRTLIGKPGYLNWGQLELLSGEGWEISVKAPAQAHRDVTGRSSWSPGRAEANGDSGATERETRYPSLDCASWNMTRFVVDGRWPLWLFKMKVLHGFHQSSYE